jgi:hypothetical protein
MTGQSHFHGSHLAQVVVGIGNDDLGLFLDFLDGDGLELSSNWTGLLGTGGVRWRIDYRWEDARWWMQAS